MRHVALILAVLGAGGLQAQEDLEAELDQVAAKLNPGGAAGQLARLLKTEGGRLVVKERIQTLTVRAVERLDRDPLAHYEKRFFIEDADGNLRLRPERKDEIDALGREVARRSRAWQDFDRRGAEIGSQVSVSDELGKRLKVFWSDPEFRRALFQQVGEESREPDPEELWTTLAGRSLFPGKDGKLRLRGSYRNETIGLLGEIRAELDGLAAHDEGVGKLLAGLEAGEKRKLSGNEGRALIGRRLAALAAEGAEDPVKRLAETDLDGPRKRLKGDARAWLDEADALAALGTELKPILDRDAAGLTTDLEYEKKFKGLLDDARARVLLVSRLRAAAEERRAGRDGALAAFRDDHFDADGQGKLTVKKGRFVGEDGGDSPAALAAECEGILAEFAATRATFEEIVERALDASVVRLFATREGAGALAEHMAGVLEDLKRAEREGGVRKFAALMLVREGTGYAVRPERAGRVDEMAKRAREVEDRLERAGREEASR